MNRNQACGSCHHESANFADPDNTIAPTARPVSQGSNENLFGGRNAPTSSYVGFSPKLHWNTVDGLYIGGLFWDGLAIFNADSDIQLSGTGNNVGGMCYLCHLTERHNPDYAENSTQFPNPRTSDGSYAPMLTDFSYDNLGIPVNPRIAVLAGPQAIDFGLGAASRQAELSQLYSGYSAADEEGKFRVPTLRNIAGTAPYGHNGFFPTLYSIVHFYNTRDSNWPGESFPAPEVAATVNADELGNLGLSFEQEKKIVLFLKTLIDR